jgi:hypothetical protein
MCRIHCAACEDLFTPRKNVPLQRFCSKPACQRQRRRRWQKRKLQVDADYRANQAAAQQRWLQNNPDYWRDYRQSHPAYAARNREQQQYRDRKQREAGTETRPSLEPLAKMDAYPFESGLISGTYQLIPVAGTGLAKMDAYVVEMRVISSA